MEFETRIVRLAIACAVLLALSLYYVRRSNDEDARPGGADPLAEAAALLAKDQFAPAEALAAEVLLSTPHRFEAQRIAAQAAGGQGKFEQAAAYLQGVAPSETDAWLESRLLLGRIYHHRLARIGDALECYQDVLEQRPDHVESNFGMARLLASCARSEDAVPYILRLIPIGAEQKLPLLLLRDASIIQNRPLLERAVEAAPHDPNPRIGLAWHLLEDERFDDAVATLQDAIQQAPQLAAAWDALGKALWKAERYDDLVTWIRDAPEGINGYANSWVVRAELARRNGDDDGVTRCLLEAARLRPESRTLHFQVVQQLSRHGDPAVTAVFEEHLSRLEAIRSVADRLFTPGRQFKYTDLVSLVELLETAGRDWEALSWGRVAMTMNSTDAEFAKHVQDIATRCESLPLVQTVRASNPALDIDIDQYQLPVVARLETSEPAIPGASNLAFRFEDDAAIAGLNFTFQAGYDGEPTHRITEFTGGGIGVLDFDRDGYPDVYFAQGDPDWDVPGNPSSDVLYRNESGHAFRDVSVSADVREDRFSQGVTCGDFNSDGFPDVYVGKVGRNQLWQNNGDGTFSDVTTAAGFDGEHWTTSCQLADIDGDGDSDIYDVNYVTADDVYERICANEDGSPAECTPLDFEGDVDAIWLSDGRGRFRNATNELLNDKPDGKGLGIVSWDADGSGRLSIFIADDISPNILLQPESDPETGPFRLRNVATAAGVSVNRDGKPEACMGVAVGDLDHDGILELFVTNFYHESNTLYQAQIPGIFEDRTRDVNLHHPTWNVLGFGTQFLDANLDGELEFFLANGHVEDSRRFGTPYQMRPQYFAWNGARFDELNAESIGPYFQQERVGRAVATIDWNRDDRQDLLVGQMAEPAALLTNRTPATGRSLCLQLVGRKSHRDAFGTTVQVQLGDRTLTHQLVAGSGYMASNERQLIIGCGEALAVDDVTVSWPSGETQSLGAIPLPARLILVEGEAPLVLPDA